MTPPTPSTLDSRAGLGAAASVVQSALFIVIALSAFILGIDRFVTDGFAVLAAVSPFWFLLLCGSFVLIAVLGLAITPAELDLIEQAAPGLARFGAALASFGHAGTIAFFSWWGAYTLGGGQALTARLADALAPMAWGVMFELVLVGAWVWIIAWVGALRGLLPRGFVLLSVVKATSFWFTFAAFLTNAKWMLVLGLGATALVTGPAWHLWVARLFPRTGDAVRGQL